MNLTTLACPKCGADMRTYERSGIHVDQCAECRGIFLDRGELERLMDAETAHYARDQRAAQPSPPVAAPAGPSVSSGANDWARSRGEDARPRGRDDRDDWDDDRDDRRRSGDGRRRGGFLGDMFEMLGD